MKRKVIKLCVDFLFYLVGCFIYSLAVTTLISANEISPGGVTGISTVLNYLFSLPLGLTLLALNIPILILGFIKFGGIFIIKTSIVTVIASISLTVTDALLPVFKVDKILAAVFGGILMGLGLSLVMLRGATTGGIDILAKLINRRFRHLTVGKLILIMDVVIITIAAFVYKNIESALYSAVSMYATSIVMDSLLYGSDTGKLIYIVTSFESQVCRDINHSLSRGVTVIPARGGYTGKERSLLLCTVRRHEVSAIYDILDKYDRNAFVIVADAGEIVGEGFKPMG